MRHEEHVLLPGNQGHCELGPGKAAQCVPAGFPTSGCSPDHCSIKLLEIKTSVYMGNAFLKNLAIQLEGCSGVRAYD